MPEELLRHEVLIEGWQVVCANVVKNAALEFEECLKNGLDVDDAYEQCCKYFCQKARKSWKLKDES